MATELADTQTKQTHTSNQVAAHTLFRVHIINQTGEDVWPNQKPCAMSAIDSTKVCLEESGVVVLFLPVQLKIELEDYSYPHT